MTSNGVEDFNPDGQAFDDYFESLGKKAEHLSTNEQNGEPATTSTDPNSATQLPTEGEDDQKVVDEIESLCMNCHKDGTTRLLLTRIPYFREIIIMSFECPHCHFKNSQIQSAGEIQQKGCRYELRLLDPADFARQVVKSDTGVVKFIELDVEVPAGRGQFTNMEGLLSSVLEDLALKQDERKVQIPEVWVKIEEILEKGRKMLAGESFPFRLSLDDPAGNSWIEPDPKDGVGKWRKVEYIRTAEQNEELGIGGGEGEEEIQTKPQTQISGQPTAASFEDKELVSDEVYSFPSSCPGCTRPCTTHMKMVEIPHFKQVVIMSTVCDNCGFRSNEVKTGGAIPVKGKKILLKVESPADLARDILKSESCALECPELSLAVNPGTLGGRFTTVEGLLTQIRDDLRKQIFDIGDDTEGGDSLPAESKSRWEKFFDDLEKAINGEKKFTIVLRDPLAGSYVQNVCLPEKDPQLEEEEYDRTAEEEEDLGLADMKTEGYEEDVKEEAEAEVKEDEKAIEEVKEGGVSNG